jgi:hypothetical protein
MHVCLYVFCVCVCVCLIHLGHEYSCLFYLIVYIVALMNYLGII